MSVRLRHTAFILSASCLFLCIHSVSAGWYRYQEPEYTNYNDIAVTNSGTVYVVGDEGICYRLSDEILEELHTFVNLDLNAIWAFSDTCIYAGGEANTLLKWNGGFWNSESFLFSRHNIMDLWGSSEDDLYLLASELYHWDGNSWTEIPGIRGSSIWGSGPNDVFVVFGNGVIYHFDGTEWTEMQIPDVSVLDIHGNGPNDVYGVGAYGNVIHYDGNTWTHQNSGTQDPLLEVVCAGENNIYAASDNLWHYDGAFWTEMEEANLPGMTTEIAYVSDDEMYFSGPNIATWNGVTIEKYDWITIIPVYAAWGDYPDDFYTAGYEILHCREGQWFSFDSPEIRHVLPLGENNLYAVNWHEFYFWDGDSWDLLGEYDSGTFTDIWGNSLDNIWIPAATAYFGAPTMWHWDGENFEDVFHSTKDIVYSGYSRIWGQDPACLFMIYDYEIFSFDSTAPSVESIFTFSGDSHRINDIHGFSENDVYAACDDGIMLHWDGLVWTEQQVNTTDNFTELVELNDGTLIACTARGFHYLYDDIWLPSHQGDRIKTAIGDSLNDLMTFGINGKIMVFDGFDLSMEFISVNDDCVATGGESFWIDAILFNPGDSLYNVPVVIYMDIFGELYFWPEWKYYDPNNPPEIEIQYLDLVGTSTRFTVIPEFIFPKNTGSEFITGIRFYGAMLTDDLSNIRGDFGVMTFSY
ncbi:MAG TPA: hypothetical protein PLV45_05010 [bacterium]|nr:hypothetical protein [bacterium]